MNIQFTKNVAKGRCGASMSRSGAGIRLFGGAYYNQYYHLRKEHCCPLLCPPFSTLQV